MQWETATPVGFPVCMRHNDCRVARQGVFNANRTRGFHKGWCAMKVCHRGNLCTACALRAHCVLLLDYVPPEEPPSKPLGNALRIR